MISAAAKKLSACGCTTRKAACRLYVKGTQARSPKTSMKPKPSWTISMVVRTASCQEEVHVKCVWEHNELSVGRLRFPPHLIPQSVGHIQQLETVDQDHGQWRGASELHLLHQHAQVDDHLKATTVTFKSKLHKPYLRKSLRKNSVSFQPMNCRLFCVPVQLLCNHRVWNWDIWTGRVIVKAESFPYSTGSKSLPHTVCRHSAEAFSVLTDASGFKTFRCAKVCTGFTEDTGNRFKSAELLTVCDDLLLVM